MRTGRIKKVLARLNVACLVTSLLLSGGGCSSPSDDENESSDATKKKEQVEDVQSRKYNPDDKIGPASGKKIRGKSG
jgi:hypothetical protein